MVLPIRTPLTVELLEDRTVPSGNVNVYVSEGVLHLIGDAAANSIIIEKTGNQSAAVRPLDADTTINGLVGGEFVEGIRKGLDIKMGDGDDRLQIVGVQTRKVFSVDLGAGNDTLEISSVTTKRETFISGQGGNDSVVVYGSYFSRHAAIDLGAGDDSLALHDGRFRRFATIDGGIGTNSLNQDNATFRKYSKIQNFQSLTSTTPGIPTVPGVPPIPGVPPVPPSTVAPNVALSTTGTNPTAVAAIPITATFDQAVTGFSAADITATNGTISNFLATSGTTYTFSVTPTADGTVTISIPANAAVNGGALGNTAATPFSVRSIRTDAGMTNTAPNSNDPNFQFQPSGLGIWDIQEGTGTAATNTSTVQVFYSGWLTNGTLFDQARATGSPASFALPNTIRGFQEGIAGMKPGGIRRLFVPPDLGYGSTASGSIPANSTLIFEVKMVAVVS